VALRSWNKPIDLARKSIASLDICATGCNIIIRQTKSVIATCNRHNAMLS
jgi:hypothetical protein